MIDLIIFDCDGVLIDSEIISADTLISELALIGIAIDRHYVRKYCLGRSFPTVAKSLREQFDTPLPDDFEQRYRSSLLHRFETQLEATQGIETLLETLDRPICVATSSSPPRVARSLELTGLARFFGPHVFTASQVKNGKPAPDLFLFAAKEMGVEPSRTLVIEDSIPGLNAAQSAGMPHLAYTGASHLRGLGVEMPDGVQAFDNWTDFTQVLKTIKEAP